MAASPLVILLSSLRCWCRPSRLGRGAPDAQEERENGIGELKGGAVVVEGEVCTTVGIGLASVTRAGVAFLLFEESRECSGRPKDNPTADAPTTVAVAQSCR